MWDVTVFNKNRERLLAGDVVPRFLARLVGLPSVKGLLSREHFAVDGTLIEAWVSIKSFRASDEKKQEGWRWGGGRNRPCDFRGVHWSNATHRSTTNGECRLYRKDCGKEAKLNYMGHVLMKSREVPLINFQRAGSQVGFIIFVIITLKTIRHIGHHHSRARFIDFIKLLGPAHYIMEDVFPHTIR